MFTVENLENTKNKEKFANGAAIHRQRIRYISFQYLFYL